MDTPELDIKSLGIRKVEDPGKWVEKGVSREKVIESFDALNNLLQSSPDDPAKPELTWLKKAVQDGRSKTDLENGRDTFELEFENHETGEQLVNNEGIPVDALLRFVAEELKKYPKGSPEWKKLREQARIVYRSSKRFYELPHRMEPSMLVGRIHHEAKLISEDQRSTSSMNEDWYKSEGELGVKSTGETATWSKAGKLVGRLELVLPSHKRGTGQPSASTPIPQTVNQTTNLPSGDELEGGTGVTAVAPTTTQEEADALEGGGQVVPTEPPPPSPEGTTWTGENTRVQQPEQVQPQSVGKIIREFLFASRHTDVKKRAAEMAEEQLRNEMRRGSSLNPLNWPRKVGLRIMEQYFRQQYIGRAEKAMLEHNNTNLTMNLVRNAVEDANNKVNEEREAGKTKVEQIKTGELIAGQEVQEAQGALKQMMIRDIIRPVIDGQITDYAQVQQKLREFVEANQNDPQVQAIFGRDATRYGELAKYFATDLLETGEAIKQDLAAHRYALDQLDEVVKINLANTDWAAETEANFNNVDKAIAWAQSHRLTGSLINPATIGAAASLITFAGMKATGFGGKAISWVVPFAGALPGALFAAARRNYDLKVDRAAHQVERTYNMQIVPEARRRQALENYSYSVASVNDLLNGGRMAPTDVRLAQREVVIGDDRRGLKELQTLDLSNGQDTNREAVIRRIAEIKTRLDFSSQHNVDLVTFESRTQVEQGRLSLVRGVVEARKALRNAGMSDAEIAQMETRLTTEWNQRFTQNREQQDREFAHYRLRNAAGAAVFGGIAGLAGGLISQEAFAQIAHHTGASELPIIGGLFHKGQTTLEKGINAAASHLGHPEFAAAPPSMEVLQDLWVKGGNVELGHNVSATLNSADQSLTFVDNTTHKPFPGLSKFFLGPDGRVITPGKIDNLPSQIKNVISGWDKSPTYDHSLNQQIHEAVSSGHPETITADNLKIEVNGNHVSIIDSVTGQSAEGHINPDRSIQLSGADQNQLRAIRDVMENSRFQADTIVDRSVTNPSVLDQAKDILNQPNPKTISVPDVGEVTITPSSGEISIKPLIGDAITGHITSDGTIKFDLPDNSPVNLSEVGQTLKHSGFTGVSVEDVAGKTTTTEIPGKTVIKGSLEHFREQNLVEKAHRLFWHDNSTPMHLNEQGILVGADGKELQFYHNLLKGDVVDLDMSKMVSQITPAGGVNWDSTIDSQYNHVMNDIITNPDGSRTYKNFFFLITPNDAADNAREVIKIAVGPDGHAQLPPGSDLHKFFDTSTGKPTQLARFIEVAHQEADGSRTILSTSVGKGVDQITTVTPPEHVTTATPGIHKLTATPPDIRTITHNFTFDSIPPDATLLTPPSIDTSPMIPFPFAPRHPLEGLLFLYGYGGSYSGEGLGWMGRDEWEQRRSKVLRENPTAKLDEAEEVVNYLSRLDPQYRAELEQMNIAMGTPMSTETRAVVTIPAFGEGKIIRKTLEQFLHQKDKDGNPLNPNLFEIIVYENDTETRPKDETEAEIRKFKREHPELNIQYAYKRWTQEDINNKVNTIGNRRKYNCDLALLRSSKRTTSPGELIIINNDADLEGISPKYIADVVAEFDSKDHLDSIVGKRDLPDWALRKPNVRAGQRMWEIFDAVMRRGAGKDISPDEREKGWPGMIGENSAMRASIYAAVGGYNPRAKLAEDQELGYMMRVARNYDDTKFEYLNRLQTVKNPRRYLTYMFLGKPLIEMYNDYHENKDIRALDNQQLLNHISDNFDVARFQLDADGIYQKKSDFSHYKNGEFDKIFARMMSFMGAEYVLEERTDLDGVVKTHVKITNTDRLLKRLNTTASSRTNPSPASVSGNTITNQANSTPPVSTTNVTPTPTQAPTVAPTTAIDTANHQVAATPAAPTPTQAPEQTPTTPINLVDRVNQTLAGTVVPETTFEATPTEIIDYLKTVPLPRGAKFGDLQARVENNQIVLNGSVKGAGSTSNFSATLAPDVNGVLNVINHQLQPGLTHRPFVGQIEPRITNLNGELVRLLESKVDPAWQVAGIKLMGNNLGVDFKRR